MRKRKKRKKGFTYLDYANIRVPADNIYRLIKAGKHSEAEKWFHILVKNIGKLMEKDFRISD